MKAILRSAYAILLCVTTSASSIAAADEIRPVISNGRDLASKYCSRCHGVTTDDVSQHPQAPVFRTLGKRYPIESLEEALVEGIFTGHLDMPEFRLQLDDIDAMISYLRSIQQK